MEKWCGRRSSYPDHHSRGAGGSDCRSRTPASASTRQRLFEIGEAVGENRVDRRVFGQLVRINLVERVGRSVVIVEIETTVLDRAEIRDTELRQRVDVGPGLFSNRKEARTGIL